MAVPWYTRINPNWWGADDSPAVATTAVARRMAGVAASVQLRDHPQITAAYLRSNVPLSVARRADMELRRHQLSNSAEQNDRQGTAVSKTPAQIDVAERDRQDNNRSVIGAAYSTITGALSEVVEGGLHLLGTAYNVATSPLQVPAQAFKSNAAPGDIPTQSLTEGIRLLTGLRDLSPSQQADLRRSGYDPDSLTSRFAWYFRDMSPGQHAVTDEDVRRLSAEFGRADADAAREIVTSNFLNDQNPAQLTKETQQFAARVYGGDERAGELVSRMNEASLTSSMFTAPIVNSVGDLLGAQRGSAGAKWTALALDTVALWNIDPFAASSALLRSARVTRYGVSATAGAQGVLDKIVALERPGDTASGPAFRIGKVWNDDIIAPIDRVVRLNDEASALARAGEAPLSQIAALESEAGAIAENFARRHPDLMPTWDLVMGMRTGNYKGVRVLDPSTRAGKFEAAARRERLGKTGLDPFVPVTPSAGTVGRPAWELRLGPDGAPTAESLNEARATLMGHLSAFVWAQALSTGAPLVRGQRLLPGEVALNRRLRTSTAFNAIRDAVTRPDASLNAALGERGLVNFTGDFDRLSDVVVASGAGNYYKAEHVDRVSRAMERMHSRFAMSPSGRSVAPGEVIDSTETYRRLVSQFMPRRLANIATNRWAMASPAEQIAQWRQTWEMIVEMQPGLARTPEGRDLVNHLTKGVVPTTSTRGARMEGPREVYTLHEADNVIRADGYEMAAGIYPYQMNSGFVVPNIRALRQLGEKGEFISALAGRSWARAHLLRSAVHAFGSAPAATATGLWKVGKVANPANMSRQALELAVAQTAENGLNHLMNVYRARRGVVLEHLESKIVSNATTRAANRLENTLGGTDELTSIAKNFKFGDWGRYREELELAGRRIGLGEDEIAGLRKLADARVDYQELVRKISPPRAAAARTLESLRRLRAHWYRATGASADDVAAISPHGEWADAEFVAQLQAANLSDLSGAASNQLLLDRGVDDLAEVANKGFGGKMTRTPNARQLLGTAGDSGARRWFTELDSRQWDKMPFVVMQGVAHEALMAAASPSGALSAAAAYNASLRAAGRRPLFPESVNSASEMARYLIARDPKFRQQAIRLHYDSAGHQVSEATTDEAVSRLADVWVRDLAGHLGLKVDPRNATVAPAPDALTDMLSKLDRGIKLNVDDLSRIPDDLRPAAVSDSLFVPLPPKGRTVRQWLVEGGAKAYSLMVARPLQRLMVEPVYIANRNLMYRQLEAPMEGLVQMGFTRGQASALYEYTTHKAAVNATFRGTDNVAERSMFSELAENVLMFNRAQEDFFRRFAKVTSANPAIFSRAVMLSEAAQHSGLVYQQVDVDDQGQRQAHTVFVYPASALMARAFQEVGRALGWGDDLNLTPLFSSMSSQVVFLNPSLTRPIAFSASPLIGTPLRVVRDLFPETGAAITPTLAMLEGQNQETYFAEQGVVQQWLPAPLARLAPLLDPEAVDGQLASAIRNATIYYHAAGLMPGENASPDDIEDANNAIVEMAMNQMAWRALVGFFLPAAPQYDQPQGLGLPDVSALTRATGTDNLRGEWFDVLRQASQAHGMDAMSYASVEWFRRYPHGESIINPEAYLVGTTLAPGTAEQSGTFPSGEQLGAWVFRNRDWIADNRAVAYHLLPGINEPYFSPTVMRLQLRLGLREHKTHERFAADVAFAAADREWWDRLAARNAAQAAGNTMARSEWKEWERRWRERNPRSAAEHDRRNNPAYVHSQLAPALEALISSGSAPPEVDMEGAGRILDHYKDYRHRYLSATTGDGRYQANDWYRNEGNRRFTGTPVSDLWRAMSIYETE